MDTSLSIVKTKFCTPSEVLDLYKRYFDNQNAAGYVVLIRGIYQKNPSSGSYGNYRYDWLKDEHTADTIQLMILTVDSSKLQNGNLVLIRGTFNISTRSNGSYQVTLRVSEVEVSAEVAVTDLEKKMIVIRQTKISNGYKDVTKVLKDKLYQDVKPKIALVFAGTSITDADFDRGINAAKSFYELDEKRVSFANSAQLASTLNSLYGYDAVAIVRGGGSGLEKLDDLTVLSAVAALRTPTISAIGHQTDKVFIKQLCDYCVAVPHDLGTYLYQLANAVKEEKANTKAVLIEQVRKQFEGERKAFEETKKQFEETKKQYENRIKESEETKKQYENRIKESEETKKKIDALYEQKQKETDIKMASLNKQVNQLKTNRGCMIFVIVILMIIVIALIVFCMK